MSEEGQFIEELLNPGTQNEAFGKLMRQYRRPLYAHIRSIVLNHDDTDDVLQNTFLKVFRGLNSFKQESKLFTWIYRIATNEALTFVNAKSKRNGLTSGEYQTQQIEQLHADSYFDGDQVQIKLQQAVVTLPEKQQLVFKMKYYQEMKYEEISEVLGTTVGALKASYFHAVKKIEEFMNSH